MTTDEEIKEGVIRSLENNAAEQLSDTLDSMSEAYVNVALLRGAQTEVAFAWLVEDIMRELSERCTLQLLKGMTAEILNLIEQEEASEKFSSSNNNDKEKN